MTRIAICLLAALALAGCGGNNGDSREEFEEDVRGAQQELEAQLEEFGEARSPDDVSEALGNAADALREQADELDESDVPDEAEEARDQLVESLRSLAGNLDENAEAAGDGDVGEFLENIQNLDLEAVREFEEALERLREQGFDVDVSS
jgi:Asp-tRNA(Asn)/Glu-tRNA(Gln) amidotransferase A subunit family amidase